MSKHDIITGDSKMDTQLLIEQRQRDEGVRKMADNINRNRQSRGEAQSDYGHQLLVHGLAKFSKGIDDYLNSDSSKGGRAASVRKLLIGGDSKVIAYVFMKFIINGISIKNGTLQSIITKATEQVEDEYRLADLRKQDKALWKRLCDAADKRTQRHWKRKVIVNAMNEKAAKGEINNWTPWTGRQKLAIGTKLLTILIETVGLVRITTESRGKNNTVKRLVATEETMEWISKRESRVGLTAPAYKPLVVQPRDWTQDNLTNGIYYSHYCRPVRFVKTYNAAYFEELENADMEIVLHAVNSMQRTAWSVNKPILKVINDLWDAGVEWCPSIPAKYNEEEPNRDEYDMDCEQSRASYFKERARVQAANRENAAKRIAFATTMDTASEYSQYPEFYFGYNLDFRGRVYAVSAYNGMGPDEMKSTLQFANGKPLGERGSMWLAIHLANVGDFDKISKRPYAERVKWVEDNEDWIVACANNPFENREWIEADKPLQFLAAAMEWQGFIEQGEDFISHLPIALDGACSGLQHLSMATKCATTAANVNILPNEEPQDLYQVVADKVMVRLREDASKPHSHWGEPVLNNMGVRVPNYTELAQEWLAHGFGRKEAKTSVMTYSYGSKQYGFKTQIQETVMKKALAHSKTTGEPFPFSYDNGFRAASYIARLLWDAVVDSVKRPAQVMEWLTACASLVAKQKFKLQDGSIQTLPVRWTTPLGFPVVQSYYNMSPRRVKTSINGNLVYLTLNTATDQICSRKSAQGMSPNVVHSWDSSHLMLTVSRCADQGLDSFSLIHDSFGTLAADTDVLFSTVREAMVEMYESQDVLHELYLELLKQLAPEKRDELPLPPAKGSLVLADTLDALYSFS